MVKMSTLPKLIYMFHVTPVKILGFFFFNDGNCQVILKFIRKCEGWNYPPKILKLKVEDVHSQISRPIIKATKMKTCGNGPKTDEETKYEHILETHTCKSQGLWPRWQCSAVTKEWYFKKRAESISKWENINFDPYFAPYSKINLMRKV